MADRVITAEAIISAKDNTGDVFANIARKVQGIGKVAKSSVELEGLTKGLRDAQQQLKALDALQKNRSGLTAARTEYRQQQKALEDLARSMRQTESPTRQMRTEYQSLQRTVASAARDFEKQAAAAKASARALETFGTPLNKIASEQTRLRAVIDSTTKAIERQAVADHKAAAAHVVAERAAERRSHGIAHHGIANYALGAAAGYASAHAVVGGVERAVHLGSEYNSQIVALQNAGRTPDEIRRMQAASARTALAAPTSDYIENLKVLNETTGAFGSVEHAMEHLTFMQKMSTVLHATAGDKISDGPGELGNKLARFFEMRGTANNGELFEKEASEMVRAMVFTGGNFNPGEMLNFAQQAKSSLQNYSLDYMSKVAPSLISEVGGDRAGTQANAFTSVILGKANDKRQAEAWLKYGLIDPKQMVMKGGTPVAWSGGAVYHTDTALQNPLEYGEKYLLPALKAHGVNVDDRLELTKVLGTLFRNQNSNAFANENWQTQNRQRLHKDHGLIEKVDQPDSIFDRLLNQDSRVALHALSAATRDLLITMASPLMPQAASGMTALSYGMQHVANYMKDNPILATGAGLAGTGVALGGAGYMSYQLANGFGLGGAATALDASAGLLSSAAEAQLAAAGRSAVLGGAAHAAEGLPAGGLFRAGIGSAVMTVGSLAIAGIAAVAVIDALSSGRRKPLASDSPDYMNPFATGKGASLPSGLPGSPGSGAAAVYGRGRPPATEDESRLPGHWTYGRGGFREWVVDRPPGPMKNPPFFGSGYTDRYGEPDAKISGALGYAALVQGAGQHRRISLSGSVPEGGFFGAPMPTAFMPGGFSSNVGPPLDIRPAIQRLASGPAVAPPFDPSRETADQRQVTAELHGQVGVRIDINAPPGLVAGTAVTATGMVKPSIGTTMAHAGIAHPAGRGD